MDIGVKKSHMSSNKLFSKSAEAIILMDLSPTLQV